MHTQGSPMMLFQSQLQVTTLVYITLSSHTYLSMLGFPGYACAITSATDTFGEGTGPVWLNNVRCSYYDQSLDECAHDGLRENWCPHSQDAAVICQGIRALISPLCI